MQISLWMVMTTFSQCAWLTFALGLLFLSMAIRRSHKSALTMALSVASFTFIAVTLAFAMMQLLFYIPTVADKLYGAFGSDYISNLNLTFNILSVLHMAALVAAAGCFLSIVMRGELLTMGKHTSSTSQPRG